MIALGLMSGTSCDGIDAAIIETNGHVINKYIAEYHLPYKKDFSKKLLSVMNGEIPFYFLENELTYLHAEAIENIMQLSGVTPDVIGFHGQTIFHNSDEAISIQIGNPHILAKKFGIKIVYDFRRRDMICGGKGAPLIPIFHQAIMRDYLRQSKDLSLEAHIPSYSTDLPLLDSNDHKECAIAVINIGGVSNATYIKGDRLLGYDLGPGNAYINDAMTRHFSKPYDKDGIVAASGVVCYDIVDRFLSDDFFHLPLAPKSLDRNHFRFVMDDIMSCTDEDKIATLTMITARSIAASLAGLDIKKIFLCGGGARNKTLVAWIKESFGREIEVLDLSILGFKSDYIEAQGFAFLAVRCVKNLPSSFPSTTGVKIPTIAGVVIS